MVTPIISLSPSCQSYCIQLENILYGKNMRCFPMTFEALVLLFLVKRYTMPNYRSRRDLQSITSVWVRVITAVRFQDFSSGLFFPPPKRKHCSEIIKEHSQWWKRAFLLTMSHEEHKRRCRKRKQYHKHLSQHTPPHRVWIRHSEMSYPQTSV